ADNRRPIWVMGHMVNSLAQIDEFVNLGANSIETDVSFDRNCQVLVVFDLKTGHRWQFGGITNKVLNEAAYK
uniref:Dermonecrotic toxin LgSicTox-alphaI-Loxn-A (Fragments) n=1 Tax=Loxosceles gaucho TaxID=58216 RepID=A1XA_LOXGA|nr:RecName: Full=Dermonecrotic toxin LgSicTox-alphaI-Loxn-A; AltName: Full=Loxnecrogin-A; AltName: Full=Phospholipase D; Short=PLD; AltName: Full=Sphingomyelin phosphodiesterase D; Short=SMD; Short=SMase D; Short=Sphingomyelinase D [Loxosceles gaucho]